MYVRSRLTIESSDIGDKLLKLTLCSELKRDKKDRVGNVEEILIIEQLFVKLLMGTREKAY